LHKGRHRIIDSVMHVFDDARHCLSLVIVCSCIKSILSSLCIAYILHFPEFALHLHASMRRGIGIRITYFPRQQLTRLRDSRHCVYDLNMLDFESHHCDSNIVSNKISNIDARLCLTLVIVSTILTCFFFNKSFSKNAGQICPALYLLHHFLFAAFMRILCA
jgi:hypothetical protein